MLEDLSNPFLVMPFAGFPWFLGGVLLWMIVVGVPRREALTGARVSWGVLLATIAWWVLTLLFAAAGEALDMWPGFSEVAAVGATVGALVLTPPAILHLERSIAAKGVGRTVRDAGRALVPQGGIEWTAAGSAMLAAVLASALYAVVHSGGVLLVLAPWSLVMEWTCLAAAVSTGLCATMAGVQMLHQDGSVRRGVCALIAGLGWCLLMALVGFVMLKWMSEASLGMERRAALGLSRGFEVRLEAEDLTPEERARLGEQHALWRYIEDGLQLQYIDREGERRVFEPTSQQVAMYEWWAWLPKSLEKTTHHLRVFIWIWPGVALAGVLLGLLRRRGV